ncbi:GAF domain-containing protein [Segetibacter sp. 3557_3]|uniref:GAF domain-containing protein n=1 Tax=Segetibacter sp. 3557_3 TaxID=2547429 RepID=UPI0010588774|nr:GAF domain-containing protein [Segetibacter sp. 3557_3]TDH24190.1 GAF domain-containing protein [Segetibacter sp. 3557_3]
MDNEAELEVSRIKAVHKYKLIDTSHQHDLEDLIEVASDVCGTPVALITLIDDTTQYFKVKKGIDWHSSTREESFCKFTIAQDSVLVIEDTLLDNRIDPNGLFAGTFGVRFYAGAPLTTPDGFHIGSLCVANNQPQQLDAFQISCLQKLAALAMERMEGCLNFKALEDQQENMTEVR